MIYKLGISTNLIGIDNLSKLCLHVRWLIAYGDIGILLLLFELFEFGPEAKVHVEVFVWCITKLLFTKRRICSDLLSLELLHLFWRQHFFDDDVMRICFEICERSQILKIPL